MDLVVTSAPSEAQERVLKSTSVTNMDSLEQAPDWKLVESWVPPEQRNSNFANSLMKAIQMQEEWETEPLYIPDQDAGRWVPTHPLEQMRWTREKNRLTGTHYINVVKTLKWWQRNHEKLSGNHPKGYPLERLIGECCDPNDIESIAHGVTRTLENIKTKYESYARSGQVPVLPDHGTGQNVFKRIKAADFANFYNFASLAASLARRALVAPTLEESAPLWRELLGEKFPLPEKPGGGGDKKGGFVPPSGPAVPSESGRYG